MFRDGARGRRARRVWMPLFVLGLIGGLWQLPADAPASRRPRADDRPNVIVIMTDDQTVESLRVMANVQRFLINPGTTFVNSFASFPLCCPSRATFLTGQYSHNHKVVGNNFFNGLARLDQSNTLPVWLSEAGYSTIFVGKYLNEYGKLEPRSIPPGWSDWNAGVRLAYFNHTMNRNGKIVYYGANALSYQSDVYTSVAVDAVRRHARQSKPFFLWLSYFAPHQGGPPEAGDPPGLKAAVPPQRHRQAFAGEPLPRTSSFDEEDVSDKPQAVRRRARLSEGAIAGLETSYRRQLESLLAVDEGVAEIVAELRAAGVLKRTFIVFTSDNGLLQGQHRIVNAKEQVYEPSIRVPLVIRGPGVPRGARLEQPVVNADLAPTIVDVADANVGRVPDGRSLLPVLADIDLQWGRDILLERGPGASAVGARIYTAIRTPRFLYTEYSTGERELYDLVADPDELLNRHGDPELASIEAELARRLASLQNCVGVQCTSGPQLELASGADATCTRTVQVTGPDVAAVAAVVFIVAGDPLVFDEQAPFEYGLAPASAQVRLRALSFMRDGRLLTLDRTAAACS
jgi:N-acetylglucosamine-6-sulfatase